ncbi:hypothetical protein [Streptomyces benahoarensis]|uniref:Uncharacterized protein n=1 Tax=Streptomyces benahoarensis TaxID=2595054 RepID=A0A553ZPV6_9ACTN|nr:hypothetical protein [Streptomyces benahoarensis]TSB29785.1 hypothetical protein FNJ62_08835 [Streptomyces benahoarensis]TSB43425.1 hypothetical protein FNZ23_04675 [Streptomyces benahoarensis]
MVATRPQHYISGEIHDAHPELATWSAGSERTGAEPLCSSLLSVRMASKSRATWPARRSLESAIAQQLRQ